MYNKSCLRTAANEPVDIKALEKSFEPPAVSSTGNPSPGINDENWNT